MLDQQSHTRGATQILPLRRSRVVRDEGNGTRKRPRPGTQYLPTVEEHPDERQSRHSIRGEHNPYRGCELTARYWHARPTHEYAIAGLDFETKM